MTEANKARVIAAQHAMQSGVAHELHINDAASPKHLRVGVNSAIVQDSALALLLISKGVITEEEYWESQANAFEDEKALYEARLSEHFGTKIVLA